MPKPALGGIGGGLVGSRQHSAQPFKPPGSLSKRPLARERERLDTGMQPSGSMALRAIAARARMGRLRQHQTLGEW
jgi:hypothetical protein